MFEGRDLLNERARNPGQFARNLLRILFTPEELQSSLLPSTQSKRYLKPELDGQRMDLLHSKTSQLLFIDENMFSTPTISLFQMHFEQDIVSADTIMIRFTPNESKRLWQPVCTTKDEES